MAIKSYKYLLLYVAALLLLVALLVTELQHDRPPFVLESASGLMQSGQPTISVNGEHFHSGLKGVLAKNLVNQKALLWHLLDDATIKAVDVHEQLALVSCYGNKLVSIRLHEGEAPELLGSIDLPDDVRMIKIIGRRALVMMKRHAGMALIDLQHPEDMKRIASYPLPGLVTSMVADRDTVYYADMYRGLGRIDLAAEKPALETLVELKSPWSMAMEGKRLVVGSLEGGVTLFNLSASGLPVEVGRLALNTDIRGVALTEEVLAVACRDGATYLYNLAAWPKLVERAELPLPGSPFRIARVPGRKTIAISLVAGGVVLIDVRQPARPVISAELKIPTTFLAMTLQSTKIWAATLAGLQVFDLDEIEHGEDALLAPKALVSENFYQLYAWQGRLYGYRNQGLVDLGETAPAGHHPADHFLAVADENQVVLFARENGQVRRAGALLVEEGAFAALYRENLLYVINRRGLKIFSGSTSEGLHLVSELPLPGQCKNLAKLDSGFLLVGTLERGVLVVDVKDARQPQLIASLDPAPHLLMTTVTQDILVDGQRAFVSEWSGGVLIIDLSNPNDPQLQQIIDTPGYAVQMALQDDLLLVADKSEGVFMIDVRDRKHALPIGSWPTPVRVEQIAVAGDHLFVSNFPGGTLRLPRPQRLQNLEMVSRNELRADVASSDRGEYVYIYENGGAEKVRVGAP